MWLGSRTTCLMASPLLRALWNAPEHSQSYSTGPAIPQPEHSPISKSPTLSLPGPNLIGFWQANLSGPWYVRLSMLFAGLTEGNPMCRARPETPARIPRPDAGEELCGESSSPVCSEWLPAFVSGIFAVACELLAAFECTATCECTAAWLAALPFGASSAATAWNGASSVLAIVQLLPSSAARWPRRACRRRRGAKSTRNSGRALAASGCTSRSTSRPTTTVRNADPSSSTSTVALLSSARRCTAPARARGLPRRARSCWRASTGSPRARRRQSTTRGRRCAGHAPGHSWPAPR